MYITYEKMENYFDMVLKILPKDTPIFVSGIKNISDAGIITTAIMIQVIDEPDCIMFKHTEEMPIFRIVGDSSFSTIPDQTIRASAQKAYNDSYNVFLMKYQEEYNKMVSVLTGMGFIHIQNALVQ
jgi:hypothetical protein